MKTHEIIKLIEMYDENMTLIDLKKRIQGKKIHKCPKCDGTGKINIRYDAYPSGLPDSGWVQDWRYRKIECDLCKGEGYTENEKKPKIIHQQIGWE